MKKSFIAFVAIAGVMMAATTVSAASISQDIARRTALEAAGVKEEQVIVKPIDAYDGIQWPPLQWPPLWS